MSNVNRNNWREHCAEVELTDSEREELSAMSLAVTVERFDDVDTLYEFIVAHTKPEYDAYASTRLPTTWALFPAYVDICRRRDRAEIQAWHEWSERDGGGG